MSGGYEDDEFDAAAETIDVRTSGITVEINASALNAIANAASVRIASELQGEVMKLVERRLDAIMDDAWCAAIQTRAQAVADAFLDKPRHPTNQYGEVLHGRPAMTFAERAPETVNAWLMAKVDNKGAPFSSYHNSNDKGAARIDWMIASLVTANLKDETEKAAKQVTEKARMVVAQHVGRFVAEQMAPAIDVQRVGG